MHLHFERNVNSKCDCPILSLTWMGKVPDELPEDEGWKLNRTNYYQEGWLATGNMRGIVGVTFTTSHCKKAVEYPVRTNYNLRGHRSEVILVKWNEPYQKLASCDSSGIIFVWIKYEGRWSIELINDRNTPVTHFAWSHDGRMALICYNDGFVLVGSVAGQRYWSSMLNLDSTITCGIWTPDDMHVYFGTSQGGLVVMDVHGAMVAQVQLAQAPVTGMAWSCEKFKMEEGDDADPADISALVLAVSVSTGHIYLMKSYDDVSPVQLYTGLGGPLCMEWSNSRQLLAVAGVANHNADNTEYVNMLKCYSDTGQLLYSTVIPFTLSPVTALTWGHNDKRLFVATGGMVHMAWVSRRVATLQLLSRLQVAASLPMGEGSVRSLPLPPRLKHLITNLFAQTIRCCVPGTRGIREFVSRAPQNGQRLHCTMIRHDDEHMGSGACYTLYLEYLGGLVPLLKGRRTSKIRPEFVIFDPSEGPAVEIPVRVAMSDTSDTEREDGCASPRMQRRRRRRHRSPAEHTTEFNDLSYVDTLPEGARLVEVTSNIWGTKFKIHGLAECLPTNLGQVTYKTSLLHLQPRQMTLVMTELRDDVLLTPDPSFNPNVFSEDEDDERPVPGPEIPSHPAGAIPIAPMTPKNLRQARAPRLVSSSGDAGFVRARTQQRSPLYEEPRPGPSRAPPPPLQPSRALPSPLLDSPTPARALPPQVPPFTSSHMYIVQTRAETTCSVPVQAQRPITGPPAIPSYESLRRNRRTAEARSRSEGPGDRHTLHRNQSFLDAQALSFQVQAECQPSTSQGVQESSSPTYQSEIEQIVKRIDEMIERDTRDVHAQLARPESIEDEASYTDCNLNDVISFADTFKMEPEAKPRRIRRKPDKNETCFLNSPAHTADNAVTVSCTDPLRISRSCSVGFLDDVDTGRVPGQLSLILLKQDAPKRLFLVRKKPARKPKPSHSFDSSEFLALRKSDEDKDRCDKEQDCEESPLDLKLPEELLEDLAEDILPEIQSIFSPSVARAPSPEIPSQRPAQPNYLSVTQLSPLDGSFRLMRGSECHARSQPASPAMSKKKRHQSSSPIRKHFLNSPLLRRRRKSKTESSDDEVTLSGDEAFSNKGHYKDLETFQKAQLRQKLKRGKVGDGHTPRVRELVMHNKAPMWNENSQVYQLDFGGRVTQESAKNFQIEFKGKQVMQFGRIDGNAYTLDFQYPFSVVQAFAVALANVTQRLK